MVRVRTNFDGCRTCEFWVEGDFSDDTRKLCRAPIPEWVEHIEGSRYTYKWDGVYCKSWTLHPKLVKEEIQKIMNKPLD